MKTWSTKDLLDINDETISTNEQMNINAIFRFLSDPSICFATKSNSHIIITIFIHIFFIINMTVIPMRYCWQYLPENIQMFGRFIYSIITFSGSDGVTIYKSPQLYFNITLIIIGMLYYWGIFMYCRHRYLSPLFQKVAFVFDEILVVPVTVFFPASIFSDLVYYYKYDSTFSLILLVLNLIILPSFIISLFRKFILITSYKLPYTTINTKAAIFNIFTASFMYVIISLENAIYYSPFVLFTVIVISILQGTYIYLRPLFVSPLVGFFTLSHSFILTWTAISTVLFQYYSPETWAYFTIILCGFVIIWILSFLEIFRSVRKAKIQIDINQKIDATKYSFKELFYIISVKEDRDIFSDNTLNYLLNECKVGVDFVIRVMFEMVKFPHYRRTVKIYAKQILLLNSSSPIKSLTLTYLLKIASGVITITSDQIYDTSKNKKLMRPILEINRDIWRSILQENLHLVVNNVFSIVKIIDSYTSYLKQKQLSSESLHKFVNEVSLDYSQFDVVSEEDKENVEKSILSNQLKLPKQNLSMCLVSSGLVVSLIVMLACIAYFFCSLVFIISKKDDIDDSFDGFVVILKAARLTSNLAKEYNETIANLTKIAVEGYNTKLLTEHIDAELFSSFIQLCELLGFYDFDYFINTEQGRGLLNYTTYTYLDMNDKLTLYINSFLKRIDSFKKNVSQFHNIVDIVNAFLIIVLGILMGIGIKLYRDILHLVVSQTLHIPRDKSISEYNSINEQTKKAGVYNLKLTVTCEISIKIIGAFIVCVFMSSFTITTAMRKVSYIVSIIKAGMTYQFLFPQVASSFFLVPMMGLTNQDEYILNASSDIINLLNHETMINENFYVNPQPFTGTIVYPDVVQLLSSVLYPLSDVNRTFRFLESVNSVVSNFNTIYATRGHNNYNATYNSMDYLKNLTNTMLPMKSLVLDTEYEEFLTVVVTSTILTLLYVAIFILMWTLALKTIKQMKEAIKLANRTIILKNNTENTDDLLALMTRKQPIPADLCAFDIIPCSIIFFNNNKVSRQNQTSIRYYGDLTGRTVNQVNEDLAQNECQMITTMKYKRGSFPRRNMIENSQDSFYVVHDITRVSLIKKNHRELRDEISAIVDQQIQNNSIYYECIVVTFSFPVSFEQHHSVILIKEKVKEMEMAISISLDPGEIVFIFHGHLKAKSVAGTKAAETGFSITSELTQEGVPVKCAIYTAPQCVILSKGISRGYTLAMWTDNWQGQYLLHKIKYGSVAVEKEAAKYVFGHKMRQKINSSLHGRPCDYIVYDL